MRGDDTLAIERRHRVGERDFADDSLAVLIFVADAVVPVAHLLGAVVLLRRVLVSATPFVKRLAPLGIEVFAIPGMTGARVSVCGDEYVRFLAHWTSPRPGQSSRSFGPKRHNASSNSTLEIKSLARPPFGVSLLPHAVVRRQRRGARALVNFFRL